LNGILDSSVVLKGSKVVISYYWAKVYLE